ncbi:lysophospholipase L1-like esterase [Palleronia aestuarii]|uniref:Lysophospholipase L1-like esterase n=1 Tax=Palleronia aestuarii TaxID=568105 RepID=A0A2W7NYS0_9RHOB|nr:SGNH/GDSL hydrolase family protein [Palleronia aestuarii]PZX16342.1 lysophospholipase L1-like esterase [Palleronia aestuarii]
MPHLLIFGDSNTHGTLAQPDPEGRLRLDTQARWAGRLAVGLGADWRITVEGLPGRTCTSDDPVEGAGRNGLTLLTPLLQSHAPIDIVAIMLGTNDQKARFALRGIDIANSAGRLLVTVAQIAPEARRLLICPPRVRETGAFAEMFAGAEDRAASLPGHMERVAQEQGAAFFDANGVIAVDPLDGIHLDAEAHETLARALLPVVRGLAS